MLSRQLLNRGVASNRPSRLFLRPIPRTLSGARYPLAVRAYAKDAAAQASSAEDDRPELKATPAEDDYSCTTESTSTSTTEPVQGLQANVLPRAAENSPSNLPHSAAEAKTKDERMKTSKKRVILSDNKIMEMPCPEGLAEKGWFEMGPKDRRYLMKLKNLKDQRDEYKQTVTKAMSEGSHSTDIKNSRDRRIVLSLQKANEKAKKKEAREREAMEMECPESKVSSGWSKMTAQERVKHLDDMASRTKALARKLARAEGPPKGVLAPGWDKMDGAQRATIVKSQRALQKAYISIKGLVQKKKRKSIAATGLQYNKAVNRAMRAEGLDERGNHLDFAKGGVFSRADTSRMNIMSRELCDDVLERLGPSLEKHKGCDLVDINPGVGVWSEKLHDFLQPRNHILMEPDGIYGSQLESLIEKDASYKLLPVSGIIWQNLLKLEQDKLLPQQTWRQLGDPELDKPNDTLLVTLNLGYYPRRSYLGFASITHLVIHQLFTASRAHSIFQAYGQIRVLVWVHDYEKRIIVPRTLSLRKKTAIESETCSEYITEVCGADGLSETSQRGRDVNLTSARRVKKKMEEAGISTPAHRMSRLEADMNQIMDTEVDDASRTFDRAWLDDLETLQKALQDKKYPWYIDPENGPVFVKNPEDMSATKTPKVPSKMAKFCSEPYLKWLEIKRRVVSENNQEKIIQQRVAEYAAMEAQYIEISESDLQKEEKTQQLKHIEEQIVSWFDRTDYETVFRRRRIISNIIESRGVSSEPPLLEWDRRPYEPLVTKKDEFWPRQEMALIDIMPKTLWPSLTRNALADYDYFEMLLSCFCQNPNVPITERLRSLAPGADEWIIPRCPSLKDVKNGGVVALEMLTSRNLTTVMLQEIFETFMAWPFRPTKGRMLQMNGSASVHEEDMDEKGLHSW